MPNSFYAALEKQGDTMLIPLGVYCGDRIGVEFKRMGKDYA